METTGEIHGEKAPMDENSHPNSTWWSWVVLEPHVGLGPADAAEASFQPLAQAGSAISRSGSHWALQRWEAPWIRKKLSLRSRYSGHT